jgi:hypothetical protein
MATTRGNFSQLLAPGLQALMFEWLPEHEEEYSQYMDVETSESAYDEDQIIGGLGLARLKHEGDESALYLCSRLADYDGNASG